MTFSIAGTGNIAWFMGTRLVAAGHECVAVYSRSMERAQELGKALDGKDCRLLPDIKDDADVVILAVTDSALRELSGLLKFGKATVIHTAGAVSIEVATNMAVNAGVLWPVYSINRANLPEHRNIPCAWEATSVPAKDRLLTVGNAVTDVLFEARHEQRKWLHLSAVVGNNFVNHLLTICEQLCAEHGLPLAALMPILEQTVERFKTTSPALVQTGPAIRRDEQTIQSQISMLSAHPEWQQVYLAITASIQERHKP